MDDQAEGPWVGNQWVGQLAAARRRTEEVIEELESSRQQASELIAGLARERAHAARIAARLSEERTLVGLALRRMSELARNGVVDPRTRDEAAVDANEMFGRLAFAEKRLERLRASLVSATALLDAVSVPVFSIDSQCRYTAFNTAHALAVEDVYGQRIALGVNLFEYIASPDDRQDAKVLYDRCLGGEEFLVSLWRGEGTSRRHFTVCYTPMRSEAGVVEGATVVAVDTTADELFHERTETGMRAIVDGLGIPAYVLDSELRFVAFSDTYASAYERSYGVPPVMGEPFLDGIKDAAERKNAQQEFERVLAGESAHHVVHSAAETAGPGWAISRTPLIRQGHVEGVVAVGIDMADESEAR